MLVKGIALVALVFLTTPANAGETEVLKNQKEKISYGIGTDAGRNFKRLGIDLDVDVFVKGLKDSLSGEKPLLSEDELRATKEAYQADLMQKQAQATKRAVEENKQKGEAFLAENKTKQDVVTLASGLQYKILKAGDGKTPAENDTVVCHYRGTLIDGTEFDSSYKRGQPATFPVKGVIKGWIEALQLMPVGSKWQLVIPPELAYGAHGAGRDIGPNATLIFEVELLAIK
jgi:FKBP-type peptidyl-prolyl cis-trans isomerase